jgi:aryl carrier-like protein
MSRRADRQELLADIWAEVLDIEHIGVHDNLFDLGGDSLLSVQIASRAEQIGLFITPRQLLHHQTIDTLVADLMTDQQQAAQIEKIEQFVLSAR